MKTAGREKTNRYITVLVAFRVYGTEAENNSAQWGGLDVEKKSGRRRCVFFLTPFIELIRTWLWSEPGAARKARQIVQITEVESRHDTACECEPDERCSS